MTITEREAAAPVQAPRVPGAGWRFVRRHAWFFLVLTAGLALRVLAQAAYRSALPLAGAFGLTLLVRGRRSRCAAPSG